MKRVIVVFVFLILFFGVAKVNAGDFTLNYPGFAWTSLRSQASPMDDYGFVAEGVIEQGISLGSGRYFGNIKPTAFIEMNYSLNPAGPDWYNKAAPGIGLKAAHPFKGGVIQFGVKASREYWQNQNPKDAAIIFINIYYGWDLKNLKK